MCCQLYQVGTILGLAMFIRLEEMWFKVFCQAYVRKMKTFTSEVVPNIYSVQLTKLSTFQVLPMSWF